LWFPAKQIAEFGGARLVRRLNPGRIIHLHTPPADGPSAGHRVPLVSSARVHGSFNRGLLFTITMRRGGAHRARQAALNKRTLVSSSAILGLTGRSRDLRPPRTAQRRHRRRHPYPILPRYQHSPSRRYSPRGSHCTCQVRRRSDMRGMSVCPVRCAGARTRVGGPLSGPSSTR